jgi:hypothetical protein
VVIEDVLVGRQDEGREGGAHEGGALHAEEARRREVGLEHDVPVAERDVADGGEVEELDVGGSRGGELLLGPAQLLVLHLELDLVHAQLVEEEGGLLRRGRCPRRLVEPETFLGAEAQVRVRRVLSVVRRLTHDGRLLPGARRGRRT